MGSEDQPTGAPSKFSVIEGTVTGQTAAEKPQNVARRYLISVAQDSDRGQMQLGLPGIHEQQTGLFLASVSHLMELGIEPVLRRWFPNYVVDLRVAPTFGPIANRVSEFVQILEEGGIRYVHVREISNRFAGDAWHPERFKQRFINQLRESVHILEEISLWAMQSRVLVISADPQTQGSDREIFADEIRRIASAVHWQQI